MAYGLLIAPARVLYGRLVGGSRLSYGRLFGGRCRGRRCVGMRARSQKDCSSE